MIEVVFDVGLLALVVIGPLHDGVHDLFDRESVRLHLGDVVQEQSLQNLLAARGVDLEPALGRLPYDAPARLVGFVFIIEFGTDGGYARRRAGRIFLIAHHVVEHLPKRNEFVRLGLLLRPEGLVHEMYR